MQKKTNPGDLPGSHSVTHHLWKRPRKTPWPHSGGSTFLKLSVSVKKGIWFENPDKNANFIFVRRLTEAENLGCNVNKTENNFDFTGNPI